VNTTRIVVIGVPLDGVLFPAELAIIAEADTIAGGRRYLKALAAHKDTIDIGGDIGAAMDAIGSARARGRRVVVLATGDPGYFGIGRGLADRFGANNLDVHPAVSSVAAAFARVGLPWDDVVVASAHGRHVGDALDAVRAAQKAAVLTSPENPPERIGSELLRSGSHFDRAVVVSNLGLTTERVDEGPGCEWLAAGSFPDLSVVLLINGSGVRAKPVVTSPASFLDSYVEFGLPEHEFQHRAGLITKSEVRSVVLARLMLPASGVLWDVGAGSGSVGIEASLLAPGLRVIAIEREPGDVARIRANAHRHGTEIEIVEGDAPAVFSALPTPDRVFIGGGGPHVLEEALERLRPGGKVVAAYAVMARAAAAAERLGDIVQLSISRGAWLPDSSIRLAAQDPVFVCWGPK
jgi:precorrin-6Y C5,15-methyltransferase (decarboxylating)